MLCTWIPHMHVHGGTYSPSVQSWKRPTGASLCRPYTVLSNVHLSGSDNWTVLLPSFWCLMFPEVSRTVFYNNNVTSPFSPPTVRIGRISSPGSPLWVMASLAWTPNHWAGSWKPLMWRNGSFPIIHHYRPKSTSGYQGYSTMPERHLILTHIQYSQLHPTQSVGSSWTFTEEASAGTYSFLFVSIQGLCWRRLFCIEFEFFLKRCIS